MLAGLLLCCCTCCRPPSQLGPGTCLLYLFGDPLAAVASHYRRNQAYHQVQNLLQQHALVLLPTAGQIFVLCRGRKGSAARLSPAAFSILCRC